MAISLEAIERGEIRVGIVGLGYVGLPLALAFAERGIAVTGFDVDPGKIEAIAAGRSYLSHIPDARLQAAGIEATSDFARAADCQAILICVPTPLDAHLQPDLSYVEGTCRALAPQLAPGTLVVLESTTWPGTTGEVVAPCLAAGSTLTPGQDLFVAYSPEREDPGNPDFATSTIPKLVGGLDPHSGELAVALYRRAIAEVVPVADARVAEAAKLFENIFRSVNIALVNELKLLLDRMGIDVGAVIDAAATKPFGFMAFRPGPGLGGHCIPIDPYYLTWKAREFGLATRFIELAGEVNRAMPEWVVAKVAEVLNEAAKPLKGSRILVLGLAYKPGVSDMRESPSLVLIDLLEARGAEVAYHDPILGEIPSSRQHAHLAGRRSVEPGPGFDLMLLATHHPCYDDDLVAHGVPIVDTRRVLGEHPLVTRA